MSGNVTVKVILGARIMDNLPDFIVEDIEPVWRGHVVIGCLGPINVMAAWLKRVEAYFGGR